MKIVPLVSVMSFLLASASFAQTSKALPPVAGAIDSKGDWPQARPGDVDSIEHILNALYGVISGTAGVPRDWNRFRSLFVPGARLMPVRVET